MRLKKALALLLILAMMAMLFTGCGAGGRTSSDDDEDEGKSASATVKGNDAEDEEEQEETTVDEEEAEDEEDSEETEAEDEDEDEDEEQQEFGKGQELTEYFTGYSDSKSALWDEISKQMEESTDLNVSMAMLSFISSDLYIIMIPMFDVVEQTGGVMMLSNIKNAYKKNTGEGIEFGYDYVYEEESGNYAKGDHVTFSGVLDKAEEGLHIDMKEYRDDKLTERVVCEIMKNDEAAYSSQMIIYNVDSDVLNAYFTDFNKDTMSTIYAEKSSEEDFGFDSIQGKTNVTAAEMAEGYIIKTNVTYKDGKAEVELADEDAN